MIEPNPLDLIGELPDAIDAIDMSRAAREERFLLYLSEGNTVKRCAEMALLDRGNLHRRRKSDPEFGAAWERAIRISVAMLEQEAQRRAMKKSDKLLMFLLTSYDSRFKTGNVNVNTKLETNADPDALAARVEQIMAEARKRKAMQDLIGD